MAEFKVWHESKAFDNTPQLVIAFNAREAAGEFARTSPVAAEFLRWSLPIGVQHTDGRTERFYVRAEANPIYFVASEEEQAAANG